MPALRPGSCALGWALLVYCRKPPGVVAAAISAMAIWPSVDGDLLMAKQDKRVVNHRYCEHCGMYYRPWRLEIALHEGRQCIEVRTDV